MEIQLGKLSLNTKSSEDMEEGKIAARHCAFCLIPIAEKDVKKCGKCLRRVYCGQKCQTKDWKSKKASKPTAVDLTSEFEVMPEPKVEGQGHKDWCGLPACEEDLDYFVKEGGKGVVAKRLIRQGERILVGNAAQYQERSGKSGDGEGILFNHACGANSLMNFTKDFKVRIITAEKDIQPGTEITYNYVGFDDDLVGTLEALEIDFHRLVSNSRPNPFEDYREILKSNFGIICPEDCFCYNKQYEECSVKRKHLIYLIKNSLLASAGDEVGAIRNELERFNFIGGNRVAKAQMICILLYVLKKPQNRGKCLDLIPNFEKEADDIFKSVFHPKSPYSKLEGWMDYFGWKLHWDRLFF